MPKKTKSYGGLYIHIPYCKRKCPYCDFYSVTAIAAMEEFIQALIKEIIIRSPYPTGFDTLYFGGGTPSLVSPKTIDKIIRTIHHHYNLLPDAEITLEINPGTVTRNTLAAYQRAGINRLNIGIQSLSDGNLKFLGRIHSSVEAKTAFWDARNAGFENIGIDMIYGLPEQTVSKWKKDLKNAISLEPDHLSCYMLSFEQGTLFEKKKRDGRIIPLDEEITADLFLETIDLLETTGYTQYEISNFARRKMPGGIDFRSRHNRKYWNFSPYIGFGPSAHSFIDLNRSWNHRSLDRYLNALSSGKLPIHESESINHDRLLIETIYLGLRQTAGIDIHDFNNRLGMNFMVSFSPVIHRLVKEGMLWVTEKRCRLSHRGMLFLDSIAAQFF